jgi:hypothetical protein
MKFINCYSFSVVKNTVDEFIDQKIFHLSG